jgi:hypothetical protein
MNYIDKDSQDRRAFLEWLFPKKGEQGPIKRYSEEDIATLIEEIKVFNAGAIDEYLSNHVDNVYRQWKSKFGDEK